MTLPARLGASILLAVLSAAAGRPGYAQTAGDRACESVLHLALPDSMLAGAARLYARAAQAGDARTAACALYADAAAQNRLGAPDADRRFARAARAAERAGNVTYHAAALAKQGYAVRNAGHVAAGTALLRRALAVADADPGREGREAALIPLNILAHVLLEEGETARSAATFRRLVGAAEAVGSHHYVGIGSYGQGTIAFDRGDMASAARFFRRAQAAADAEGPDKWQASLVAARARLAAATGRRDEAAALLQRLVDENVAAGEAEGAAQYLEQLGGVYRQTPARPAAALAAYRRAHRLLVGTGGARCRFKFRLLEALVLYDAGRTEAARRAARPAADSVAAAPLDKPEEALAHLLLARDARLAGRPAEAVAHARCNRI